MGYAAQAQPANVCMYVSDLDKYSRCSMSLDEDPVDIASNPSLGSSGQGRACGKEQHQPRAKIHICGIKSVGIGSRRLGILDDRLGNIIGLDD